MSLAFVIQTAASAVFVALMVALAAWVKIARPTAPLDPAVAEGVFADEFPGRRVDFIWISADGEGAVARSGDDALLLYRLGDSWVARETSWRAALDAPVLRGRLRIALDDAAAPRAGFAVSGINPWPPVEALAA